ncbi:MAG: hypothetical protein PHE59_01155 [Patescibacteria group bacterium]|nr:hypothetical protein [Patescibacteria group bacterium]MDD5164279.1 hypothetical protein [Patescibacteria group bacterium]MDD5535040.1 hypothetical protein [Patescibacteria group bacterium]
MNIDTFYKNVKWNLEQIVVQVGHAEGVKGRARSGYYKSAIILAASIIEALAYKILEQNYSLEMPLEDWKCVRSNFLPEQYKSDKGERLSICERKRFKFELNKQTDFKKVNEVCHFLNVFSTKSFKKIEKVRKLRNRIHIQGLDDLDRSYTKKELEFVSSVMNELLNKINHG